MPTFSQEHWAREIASAIRKVDPKKERHHVVWAETKADALQALSELAAEIEGNVVKNRRVVELGGGGRIEGHDTKSFSGSNYCVAVWLARGPVPAEVTLRLETEQFAELWTPE